MNDKFQIGMFGKFEWETILESRLNDEIITTRQPFSIEGAVVIDVDRKYLWLEDMEGIPYVPLKKDVKYTPMDLKKMSHANPI